VDSLKSYRINVSRVWGNDLKGVLKLYWIISLTSKTALDG